MKRFIAGLIFGLVISLAAAAYASDTIQADLFPAKITVNGKEASMGDFPGGSEVLTDTDAPTFHVGNVHVAKKGDQSIISGLMSLWKHQSIL